MSETRPSAEPLDGDSLPTHGRGTRVWRVKHGEGEPTLVFVHGIPTSSYLWRNVQGPLSARYRTVAVDLIGLGRSDRPPEHSFSLGDQAETVRTVLDAMGCEEAVLVAHDIGGGVAMLFAERYPERVRALIVMDIGAFPEHWPVPIVKALSLPVLGEIASLAPSAALLKQQFRKGLHHKERLTPEVFGHYYAALDTARKRLDFLKFIRAMDPGAVARAIEAVKGRGIPALILWAEGDRFQPIAEGRRLHETLRGSRFVPIPEAGHFLQEDQPERIVREIEGFVAGL